MSGELRVRVEEGDFGPVVVARGELDLATAPALSAVLRASCDRDRDLTLDLRGLRFIDCSGIRCLLDADARSRRRSVRLAVIAPAPVRRVIELADVANRLTLVPARAAPPGFARRAA